MLSCLVFHRGGTVCKIEVPKSLKRLTCVQFSAELMVRLGSRDVTAVRLASVRAYMCGGDR